jgi:hypothetical protein
VSWWLWVLIWVLLVIGALVFLFVLLRRLWRQLRALFADLGTAADRLSAVTEELERLQDRTLPSTEPAAVFADPGRLRAQRFRARTKHRRPQRRTRT